MKWLALAQRAALVASCLVALALLPQGAFGQAALDNDPAEAQGWTLRFSDDFNRSELNTGRIDNAPPNWQVISGKWRIENNMLRGETEGIIALLRRLPGDQRVEFDAVAPQETAGDLSCFLGADERSGYIAGYFFGFGSNGNTFSKLLRANREVTRYDARIVPGKLHHVICQREGNVLTHSVDGKVIATYNDAEPLIGPGHDVVGFYIYNAGKIGNVRVYTKGAGAQSAVAQITARPPGAFQTIRPLRDLVPDPLFEELFGDTPGPTHFLGFEGKYVGGKPGDVSALRYRASAKRFGLRWVRNELLDEAARYHIVTNGKMSEPGYKERGIATRTTPVQCPDSLGPLPLPDGTTLPVIGGRFGGAKGTVWIMDPRYLDYMVRGVEEKAKEHDYWGINMFDEWWESVLYPVVRDKWYKEVEDADKEIREKYGFGKYGMPKSREDGDAGAFNRIAYRRWASDRLTETYAKMYKAAKANNPEMKLIAATEGGACTSTDLEASAPYFDITGGPTGVNGTSAYVDSVWPGALTKIYVDFTEKPVWMLAHTAIGMSGRRDPEDIREMYSQVFRNGGAGLWLMSWEFFETELMDSMFAEPAKMRAELQLTKTISKMRLPRLPKPDCAILWPSDDLNARESGDLSYEWRMTSAYAVLGPLLKSWFHFVSDRQIDRGTRNLSDYKVLYVPMAEYERASVVDKIGKYVKAGGTLVCTDPNAFTWNIDGERHGKRWEKLSGIRKVSQRLEVSAYVTAAPNALPLAAPLTMTSIAPGWNIAPINNTVRILAAYEDGSPAVTLHPYGKGRVIFFATDPLRTSGFLPIPEPLFSLAGSADIESLVEPGAPIVTFIEAIQKSAGVQMGRDIWRFKLPPFTEDPWQKETGLCLTGNYVFDVNPPLLQPNNVQTDGTYSYSRAPTGTADVVAQAGAPIPFTEGKLTNRLKAYTTRQKTGYPGFNTTPQWIVSWTDPAPAAITFDLKKEYPLKKLRFVYSGTMPALEVSGSRDGNAWTRLAAAPEETAGEDVKDVALGLEGSYRYVKLGFAARTAGETFELCEADIWGKSAE